MLARIVYALFPTLLLESTPWYSTWSEQERRDSIFLWRLFFPSVGLVYIGHYYFFDHPMALQPDSLWFRFRMSIAALCFATMLSYCSASFCRLKIYWLPATLMVWLLCYTQARTIVWYDHSQYVYAFVFVIASVMLLRTSMLKSISFAATALAGQWSSFMQAEISKPTVASGIVATLILILITRSKYLSDIRYFVATQQNIDGQRKMIEMNVEFTDRIRAFLPREISSRLNQRLSDNRHTVLQAVDEVLKPTQRAVACLFSDIRGFTQATKHSQSFVGEGVIPNVRRCNSVIEKYHGVPRKVGDLIFAYYDDPNPYINLIHCISSGFEITETNNRFNDDQPSETRIRRHVLIANGEAIVGNLGGYDSSIEITALGSPVNLLSRIDEITKLPKFKELLTESDLVVCPTTARLLGHLRLGCTLTRLDLAQVGARIRDFEEVDSLWLLPTTAANRTHISSALELVRSSNEFARHDN